MNEPERKEYTALDAFHMGVSVNAYDVILLSKSEAAPRLKKGLIAEGVVKRKGSVKQTKTVKPADSNATDMTKDKSVKTVPDKKKSIFNFGKK